MEAERFERNKKRKKENHPVMTPGGGRQGWVESIQVSVTLDFARIKEEIKYMFV